jgi:hypothetical protein
MEGRGRGIILDTTPALACSDKKATKKCSQDTWAPGRKPKQDKTRSS